MTEPPTKPKYRYRAAPQLSANQMAEYVGSSTSPTRRTSIIRDARFPKTSATALYDRARIGLTAFLTDGTRSAQHLANAVDFLNRKEARLDASDWVKRDCRSSIEAIEIYQRNYNRSDLRKLECLAVNGRLPLLDLGPTKVSVAADFTIRKQVAEGRDRIGAGVLIFSRGESSTNIRKERSKTVAGLIYTFATRHLIELGEPDPKLCLAIDVFAGENHAPQGKFAMKLRNIEDACVEIADRWARVSPPPDYDGPDY